MFRRRNAGLVCVTTALVLAACGGDRDPASPAGAGGPALATPEEGLRQVASSPMQWTGVAVTSAGNIYLNFPRWSDTLPMSVGLLHDDGTVHPFPDVRWNSWRPGTPELANRFVAVQSVVAVGDRLWVVDTGNPQFSGVIRGAARLFEFDDAGTLRRVIPVEAATPTSYLNDLRLRPDGRRAYITDSGAGGLVVVDLETNASHRALDGHPSTLAEDTTLVIDGEPWLRGGDAPKVHADGIALHGDHLYYQALTGRTLYRVPLSVLEADVGPEARARAVEAVAEVGPSDGLIAGPDGSIYLSSLEENAVRVLRPGGAIEVIAQDLRIAWPDSFAFAPDGALYVTTSRIHQGSNPSSPYGLLRLDLP
jgi:sugar lactone lactonase YvrE